MRSSRPLGLRIARLAAGLVLSLIGAATAGTASAQTIEPPFKAQYSEVDLGSPPGVPRSFGGLTLRDGSQNTLLIGGQANNSTGALYAVRVTRDAAGHIDGFTGQATRFADAPNNDGGVAYGPGGVLFLARWPNNELGQVKPGSTTTDKVIDMAALGVESSLSALAFVPSGFPGAGSLKLSSYSGGAWYDATVAPDGSGTYDVAGVTEIPGSRLPGGPEGYVYVPPGSPQFANPSMLVAEYQAGNVAAYQLDGDGNPQVGTRRTFMSGLSGAEGAFIDPLTNDFIFSTFGGGDHVIAVRGFAAPPPVLGKTVNAGVVAGRIRVREKGTGKFHVLRGTESIPVGSSVDATKGKVSLASAKKRKGTQKMVFFSGRFKVRQNRRTALTDINLEGGNFRSCPSRARRAPGSHTVLRRLWGHGKGRTRTSGNNGSGTVRGTFWLTEDRCDGTFFKVRQGVVAVRDFARHRTVVLRAGQDYLARAR